MISNGLLTLGLAVAALLFFGGRSCGLQAQADVVAAKDRALHAASASLTASAKALRAQNEQTAAAVEAAAERKRQADFAIERARMGEQNYRDTLARQAIEIERAKGAPECKAQLEDQLCVSLH